MRLVCRLCFSLAILDQSLHYFGRIQKIIKIPMVGLRYLSSDPKENNEPL